MTAPRSTTRNAEAESPAPPAPRRRRWRRRLILWLSVDLAVAALLLALVLHTPSGYAPNKSVTNQGARRYVPRYWSYLGAEIFNRAQLGLPFTLVIDETRTNEAIAQATWPQRSGEVKLYAPTADFRPECLRLLGTAEVSGVTLVLTVDIQGQVDPNGTARLRVAAVKVGAMNITLMAKVVARRAYRQQIALMMADSERIETQLVAALLDDRTVDPVFEVRNLDRRRARVRVTGITLRDDSLLVDLTPLP